MTRHVKLERMLASRLETFEEVFQFVQILTKLESLTQDLPNFATGDFGSMLKATGPVLNTISMCLGRAIEAEVYLESFGNCHRIHTLEVDEPRLCGTLLAPTCHKDREFKEAIQGALALERNKVKLIDSIY